MVPAQAYENPIKRLCAETKLHDRERNVTVRGPNQRAEGKEKARDAGNQSAVLTDRGVLCLSVCCGALSDCVYFPEGRFTSGSLGMNGELISPTESSQSLGIYSPLSQWPLRSRANNGTPENCRWVWLKARPYILGTSILLKAQWNQRKNIRQRLPGLFFVSVWVCVCRQHYTVWPHFTVCCAPTHCSEHAITSNQCF